MAEYNNPMAGMPQTEFANNPFWSGFKSAEREQLRQPFIDQARQLGELNLQQEQVKAREFMGQPAVDTRAAQQQVAKAKANFDVEKAKKDLELLPQQKQVEVAELTEKLRQAKTAPEKEMMLNLASMSDYLEKIPEQHRPMAYKQWVERTQQTLGKPLPQHFQEYRPEILESARQIKYGLVMSPQHIQKLGELKEQGNSSARVARINAGSSAEVARINQTGAKERQKMVNDAGKPTNIAAEMVRLKRIIGDPDTDPQVKAEKEAQLYGYVKTETMKLINASPLIKNLAAMASIPGQTGQNARAQYEAEMERIMKEQFASHGLTPRGPAAPAPKQQKFEIGKSYKGKTGTYVYKGGDPKDKNSFEKVK